MPYSNATKNISPYFDDFEAAKNFMRVIFQPSKAVQARELTTLQTILSNQVTSMGNHLFKDGSSIYGGAVSVTKNAPFVVINTAELVSTADDSTLWSAGGFDPNDPYTAGGLIGMHIQQGTTLAIGKIVQVDDLGGTLRLHLDMHSGTFVADGTVAYQLESYDMQEADAGLAHWQTKTTGAHTTIAGGALKAHVNPGIIYIAGVFVTITEHETIWINNTGVTGDYVIGFDMSEEDISESNDGSLQDPASGSNSGAAGANRWKVSVQLAAYATGTQPEDFYQVLVYEDNELVVAQTKAEYADIMSMLARRTDDESGSYTVVPFSADAIVFDGNNFKYRVSPGKAYVNGFEVERIAPTTIAASKPRTTNEMLETDQNILSQYGTWVSVTDTVSNGDTLFNHSQYQLVHLMTGAAGTGTSLGTARVIFIEGIGGTNNIRIFLGDSPTLHANLATCVSLCADNAGTPTPANGYADIDPWTSAQRFIKNSPIVELPHSPIQAVTGASYDVMAIEQKSVTNGVTFNFTSSHIFSEDAFVTIVKSDGTVMSAATGGGSYFPAASISGSGTGTLTVSSAHTLPTGTYDFYIKIRKSAEGSRTKTLTAEDQGGGGSFESDANGEIIFDGAGDWPEYYDVTLIELIEEDPAGTPIDVTSDGVLVTGQKNYYYDYSKITGLKASTEYRVKLHRWVHSGTGDYFSADSYESGSDSIFDNLGGDDGDGAIDAAAWANIPTFINEEKTKSYALRNCLDFRRNIVEINSSTTMDVADANSVATAQYDYYLPRIDKVWIDTSGQLGVTEGIAEDFPSPPPDRSDAMTLLSAFLSPYMYGPGTETGRTGITEANIVVADHRNYTMRDIGRLERRINNLEYYTSENQLTSEAYSEQVLDADGNLKSKNGIFVEKFIDHRNGQTSDGEYRCSMNPNDGGVLRCPFEMNHIDFEVDPNEVNANINVGDHTYTMGYTTIAYIEQPYESGCININPYAVARWSGAMQMDPMSDNWVDTKYMPVFQVDDPELAASIRALYDRDDEVGIPSWGAWRTEIIGEEVTRNQFTTRVTGINNWGWFDTGIRTDTEIITTTQIQSERNGTVLEQDGTETIIRDMGERVVDISSIAFMRTRTINFKADGLKPETVVVPYFGEDDISAYVVLVDDVDAGPLAWNPVTKTDATGHIEGQFTVPEETYRTGTTVFSLADAPSDPLAYAAAEFTAHGTLITKQKSVLTVEVPTYTTRIISESVINEETSSVIQEGDTRWSDPIAQTILIEDEGGVFIDSIDIFFCSKDRYLPVTLQIVETEVGIPSQRIVPFGQVTMKAADIISTYYDGLDPDGGTTGQINDPIFRYADDHYHGLDHPTTPDALKSQKDSWTSDVNGYTPTNFKFSDPVYLKEGTEYAIVLLSNSNNYNVRVSTLGERDQVTNDAIDTQPHLGSLLKSQNASTWTPDQNMDLKFVVHRCQFETASASNLFLRTRAEGTYWDSGAVYQASAAPIVIFDDGTRHGQYLCVADTTAAQSPTTNPEKWQQLSLDGQHDVTLLNIAYDAMVLKNTGLTGQYAFTGDSLVEFQNKTDISMKDSRQVVELYNEDDAWTPADPNVIDLKFSMISTNTLHSPVIAKNRASAVLVNNLTRTALAADTDASLDAGEYISRNVALAQMSDDLRVLLDIKNTDENADITWDSVVVKYRSLTGTKRYVERDSLAATAQGAVDAGTKDNICTVYTMDTATDAMADPATAHVVSNDLVSTWLETSQVVVDGFDENASPNRAYLSSIEDPDDLDPATGTRLIIICEEPLIADTEIFMWNSLATDNYAIGEYVIEDYNIYVVEAATNSQPSLNSGVNGEYTLLATFHVENGVGVLEDNDIDWIPMERTSVPPDDFDITSQYYEHTFEPAITPSEEFDNFTIKIEMYSENPVQVPLVRRLRAIATE